MRKQRYEVSVTERPEPSAHSLTAHCSLRIAEVVFNLPLERSFHYLVPESLATAVQRGVRVAAPFGPRELIGFVVQTPPRSPIAQLKTIRRVIDPAPMIAEERWQLAAWLADYTYCSLGEALAALVPASLRVTAKTAKESAKDAKENTEPQPSEELVRPLQILRLCGDDLVLTMQQERALRAIIKRLDSRQAHTVLLHGVTGSGKTELYLRAIERTLAQGRSTICLIPEIALTPQTVDRFRARFGERVALWHSRLTNRQRALAWSRVADGSCPIVVGTRSAVFAPVQRLGLVVLDEEHARTYKQEDVPRYHAREAAVARARLTGAVVVLGSATPSVESYYAARSASYALVTLPQRVQGRRLPQVEIVDMRGQFGKRFRSGPLSDRLQRALEETVERREQAMLLLNRRGFARTAQCKTCGTVVRCERCAVPLVYHAGRREIVCHYCNFHRIPEELCRACRKGYLRFRGAGTERIESELHRLFPVASIRRMDGDTMRGRESHQEIYEAVKARQVGLLVGTQMIAKGHDFPQVTLVGVVSADTALNLPDFRAGERTFDLLTQMAGRAGRGEQPGRVVIQTYCPTHYAIQAAIRHDYRRFYEEEIRMRRDLALPPFTHLIELTVIGGSAAKVSETAQALARVIRKASLRRRLTLLGPAPHRIPQMRRSYRVCLTLKGREAEPMVALLRGVLGSGRKFHGLPVTVDVDPC